MSREELELVALKETLESRAHQFPQDRLEVGDLLRLKWIIKDAFEYFINIEGKVPFRSYRFIYWVNEGMK